jgi:hypothetical protein
MLHNSKFLITCFKCASKFPYVCVCVCVYVCVCVCVQTMDNVIYIFVTEKRIKCLGQLPTTRAYFQFGPPQRNLYSLLKRKNETASGTLLHNTRKMNGWLPVLLTSCACSCDRVCIILCAITYLHLQTARHRAQRRDQTADD